MPAKRIESPALPEAAAPERRLVAILAADVAGYSRSMGRDEEGTLDAVRRLRRDVIEPALHRRAGRLFKTMGDGFFAEFASPIEAVRAAIDIHEDWKRSEASRSGERLRLRIGVHLGDVLNEGGDLFGDGVNVAARLESVAEPDGLCISGPVHDQVRDRLPVRYEDAGAVELRHIERPVHVYHVRWDPDVWTASASPPAGTARRAPARAHAAYVFGVVLAGALALAAWWYFAREAGEPSKTAVEAAAGGAARTAGSERPTLAVLPFANLSGEPGEDYFGDGLADDILTALSRFRTLTVIARNSSFRFRGRDPDVKQVGRELGVRYVLQGSVRKEGHRVRVTAQLVDAGTGAQLWAERYDREVAGVFDVQDEITERVVSLLVAQISRAEIERARPGRTDSPDAYEHFLRGAATMRQLVDAPDPAAALLAARAEFERATGLDAKFAPAWRGLSVTYTAGFADPRVAGEHQSPAALDRAGELVRRALELDPGDAASYAQAGWVLRNQERLDESIAAFRKAQELNPGFQDGRFADVLVYAGQAGEALRVVDRAMALNPYFPTSYLYYRGNALLTLGRYAEAEVPLRTCVLRAPGFRPCRAALAGALAMLGRRDEARAQAEEALRIGPDFSAARATGPYRVAAERERVRRALREAGLPD